MLIIAVVALREIKRLQKTIDLLISKLSFARLIKEIYHKMSYDDLRIQSLTLNVLQKTAKTMLVFEFERK